MKRLNVGLIALSAIVLMASLSFPNLLKLDVETAIQFSVAATAVPFAMLVVSFLWNAFFKSYYERLPSGFLKTFVRLLAAPPTR